MPLTNLHLAKCFRQTLLVRVFAVSAGGAPDFSPLHNCCFSRYLIRVEPMDSVSKVSGSPTSLGQSSLPWVNRVYIVDDHRFFTFALTSLVNNEADLSVCGSGHEEASVMDDISRLSPDIIVVDVRLSSRDGLSMATALRKFSKQVPILFVSSLQNPQFEVDSRWLEPCSFVEKTKDPADIILGIRQALAKFRLLQRSLLNHHLST